MQKWMLWAVVPVGLIAVARSRSQSVPPVPPPTVFPLPGKLNLTLRRIPQREGLDVIRVSSPGPGATIKVGGEVTVTGNASTGWEIRPKRSGEVPITVTTDDGQSGSVTALTFAGVGEGWGVPLAQAGPFVNTPAWEDGISMSPDASILFLHYIPITLSGFIQSDPNHPWARDVRGPITRPVRPDFPGKRIKDGHIRSAMALYGVDHIDRPFPPTALFALKRQADGTYAEPRLIGPQDDGDGSLGTFGPQVSTGSGQSPMLVVAFNEPTTDGVDTGNDVYVLPWNDAALRPCGQFYREGGQIRKRDFRPVRIGPSADGNQGNPHLHIEGNRTSLWVDDESLPEKDLYVSTGTGPVTSAQWTAWAKVGVSEPGVEEIQPFFNGRRLVARCDNRIVSWIYLGGDPAKRTSWGPMETWLTPSAKVAVGEIPFVGEPTVAKDERGEILSFVYATVRADGTIDLNAGFVRH